MTDGITATIGVRITAQDSKTPPIGGMTQQVTIADSQAYAPGNGAAGLADTLFTYPINIAGSGNHTVNLSTDLDAFGAALALTELQSLYLEADATNTNSIVLGNAATHAWVGPFDAGSDTLTIKPGGRLLLADPLGYAVGVGATDQLKIANSAAGTAVTGKLVIVGRKA